MQEVPDDLFQHDAQTFPREDPKTLEAIQKGIERDAKLRAAEEKKQAAEDKKAQTLAGKITGKASREPVAKPVPEATALKRREIKVQKIRLYFAKLGHKLTIKEPKTLPKDDAGVDELLAAIEAQLHSEGGIEKAGLFYVSTCGAVEQITQVFNPLGLQLSGPSASFAQTIAANKEQWQEVVTEFAIANAEWFMVGPGKRLVAVTVQMMLAVDAANKVALSKSSAVAVPDKLKEEASAL